MLKYVQALVIAGAAILASEIVKDFYKPLKEFVTQVPWAEVIPRLSSDVAASPILQNSFLSLIIGPLCMIIYYKRSPARGVEILARTLIVFNLALAAVFFFVCLINLGFGPSEAVAQMISDSLVSFAIYLIIALVLLLRTILRSMRTPTV